MFNLDRDPFELKDIGTNGPPRRKTAFFANLQNEIQTYVINEMAKGFEYPITGKLRGKLFRRILKTLPKDERTDFFHDTGRFKVWKFSVKNLFLL